MRSCDPRDPSCQGSLQNRIGDLSVWQRKASVQRPMSQVVSPACWTVDKLPRSVSSIPAEVHKGLVIEDDLVAIGLPNNATVRPWLSCLARHA